jgi:hypothetical protein
MGYIAISGTHYMLYIELRRARPSRRQNSCRRGALAGGGGCRRRCLRQVAAISRYSYRMLVSVSLLGISDLVQDVRVASCISDDVTDWLGGDIIVVAPLYVYHPAPTSWLST